MRKEYDFSQSKRDAVISSQGKTRITLYLDNEVLASFRERAEAAGLGYQTLINAALKTYLQEGPSQSLTEGDLRRILREELSRSEVGNSLQR